MRSCAFFAVVLLSCGSDDPPSQNGTTSSGSTTATGSTDAELCVNVINDYRAQKGLPAYERWSAGEACADTEAASDADTNTPHGAFPRCKELAQNECPGQPGPAGKMIKGCLAAMWSQGPGEGHYEMMASTKWKEVACGFHATPDGQVWSVQNYR